MAAAVCDLHQTRLRSYYTISYHTAHTITTTFDRRLRSSVLTRRHTHSTRRAVINWIQQKHQRRPFSASVLVHCSDYGFRRIAAKTDGFLFARIDFALISISRLRLTNHPDNNLQPHILISTHQNKSTTDRDSFIAMTSIEITSTSTVKYTISLQ